MYVGLKAATHDPSLSADNVGRHFDVISADNVGPCVSSATLSIAKMTIDIVYNVGQQWRVMCRGLNTHTRVSLLSHNDSLELVMT